MTAFSRSVANRAARPLRRFFDPRFDRMEARMASMEGEMAARLSELEARIDENIGRVESRVAGDLEVASEFIVTHTRTIEAALARMDERAEGKTDS